jgi:hypothetical protein
VIILHNMVVECEGISSASQFGHLHTQEEELDDTGEAGMFEGTDEEKGEAKRRQMTAELLFVQGQEQFV